MVASATTQTEMWIGDNAAGRASFLSPALLGLSAPIVVGMVVAPQLLEGGAGIVWLLLGVLFVLAACAYFLSLLAPGEVCGLVLRSEPREIAVVRRGMAGYSEVRIAFTEIGRLATATRYDHDGYEVPTVEVRTKDGDAWVVAAEMDEAELSQWRRAIGLKAAAGGKTVQR